MAQIEVSPALMQRVRDHQDFFQGTGSIDFLLRDLVSTFPEPDLLDTAGADWLRTGPDVRMQVIQGVSVYITRTNVILAYEEPGSRGGFRPQQIPIPARNTEAAIRLGNYIIQAIQEAQ